MSNTKGPDFHAVTIKFNGLVERVTTEVKLSEPFDPAAAQTVEPRFFVTQALWDTGATNSLITAETAQALGIPQAGTIDMKHAGGVTISPTYILNILLPNNVMIAGVPVIQCENIVGDFGAIIGMDIICRGDFSVTNVGERTAMSFRFPSIATVDYVVEANQIKFRGVNRNAPCPCGALNSSGKPVKFKKCCGKNL
jgi:hypothetical protein